MANILTKYVPGYAATARVTGGSVDNLKLIGSKQSEVAMVMVDAALDALKGEDKFKGNPVDVRTLMVLYPNRMHVVSIEGKGIEKMSDLKGKRVSTGSPGSATEVMAFRVIEAAGLDKDKDMRRERLGVAESTNAIKDGKIDAYFWVGGLPTAAVTDLGATPGVKIKLIDHADVLDKMNAKYGGIYSAGVIPAKTYPGQDKDNQITVGAEHPGRQRQHAGQGRLRHRQDLHRAQGRSGRRAWRGQEHRARQSDAEELADPVASGRGEILHRKRREDVSERPLRGRGRPRHRPAAGAGVLVRLDGASRLRLWSACRPAAVRQTTFSVHPLVVFFILVGLSLLALRMHAGAAGAGGDPRSRADARMRARACDVSRR